MEKFSHNKYVIVMKGFYKFINMLKTFGKKTRKKSSRSLGMLIDDVHLFI